MAFTKSLTQVSPTVVKLGLNSTSPTGGTDDLLTNGPSPKFQPNVSFINIRHHSDSFTKRVGIPARRFWDIGLQFYAQGSGTGGALAVNGFAAIDALMRSAAMHMAGTTGGTITYQPATITQAGTAKCEIWVENDGLLHKAQNAQGNITFEGVPTDGLRVNWTGRGDYQAPTIAAISGFTGGTDRAEAFLNIAGTIVSSSSGTIVPVISRMTWDRGVQLGQVEDANSSTGLKENFIRDASPTMTLTIAADKDTGGIEYQELYSDWLNKVTHNINFTHGTATGNRMLFTMPQAQINRLSRSEGDGYLLITLEYGITHTTDETEFTVKIF